MKKSILLLAGFLFMLSSALLAQKVTLTQFGVDPRDVARDTSVPNYFDRPFNGLQNVGIQTKVYLKGFFYFCTYRSVLEFCFHT